MNEVVNHDRTNRKAQAADLKSSTRIHKQWRTLPR